MCGTISTSARCRAADGRVFDLAADPFEEAPRDVAALTGDAASAAAKLRKVLDGFQNLRPKELDRAFEQSQPPATEKTPAAKKKKKAQS